MSKNNRNADGKKPTTLADKYPREFDCIIALNDALARLKELGYDTHPHLAPLRNGPTKWLLLNTYNAAPFRLASLRDETDTVLMARAYIQTHKTKGNEE